MTIEESLERLVLIEELRLYIEISGSSVDKKKSRYTMSLKAFGLIFTICIAVFTFALNIIGFTIFTLIVCLACLWMIGFVISIGRSFK